MTESQAMVRSSTGATGTQKAQGAGMALALMDYYILMYDTYFAWLPPDLIIRVGLEAAAWSFC